jgi:hypothetical protein
MSEEYSAKAIKLRVKKAREIIKSLTDVADSDHDITDDEIAIIMNIKRNLEKYFAIVDDFDDSEILTKSEEMHVIEKMIIQDATAKAFEDGTITDDEKKLLSKLVELMESIAES